MILPHASQLLTQFYQGFFNDKVNFCVKKETSHGFLFIPSYTYVNGVCINVDFICRFCGKWVKEFVFFFILSNLLILPVLVEITVGR